jgi:hypothetical protein
MIWMNSIWSEIKRGENIDLYVTVLVSFGLILLNLLNISTEKYSASITIAILGLLAMSSLITRNRIEQISNRVASSRDSFLKGRSQLSPLSERGKDRSEIIIAGVSLFSIVAEIDYFEQKLRAGCKLRFLLLSPNSEAIQAWNSLNKTQNVQDEIKSNLKILEALLELQDTSTGCCEIRISNIFLPFGLAAFDPDSSSGVMNVEMYAYKRYLGERPHFTISKAKDSKWFDYFKNQYEQLWADSTKWEVAKRR